MLAERRVKIVATIGPATSSPENLEQAIRSGLNVARLNFSHGTHEDHLKVIHAVREISKRLKVPVALLQDLQGPKIRVGQLKGGSLELVEGSLVEISSDFAEGEGVRIPSDFKELAASVRPGSKILMDDGLMELEVKSVEGNLVHAKVVYGGILKDRKGINLPGAQLPIECLTEKDRKDLAFGIENEVDYIALSFVRKREDIEELRSILEENSCTAKIIAKIEMQEATENLPAIIDSADGVMVARGDLAVEIGQIKLPWFQKHIISLANLFKKPVITATQMLDSMVESPRPTRAEITDVANAVLDGSDALMLSAETASGKYPMICLQTMHQIVHEVEATNDLYYDIDLEDQFQETAEGIAASACLTAMKLGAEAIVCLSTSGRTAALVASFRPKAKVIALTRTGEAASRLQLLWGVQSYAVGDYSDVDEALVLAEKTLLELGLIEAGQQIVMTLGTPVKSGVKTNTLKVHVVSQSGIQKLPNRELPLRLQTLDWMTEPQRS